MKMRKDKNYCICSYGLFHSPLQHHLIIPIELTIMKTVSFAIALITILFSCKSNSNTIVAKFQGHWEGSYTGTADHGAFNMNIDNSGLASGTLSSGVSTNILQLDGKIDSNGVISLTYRDSLSSGTFTGTANRSTATGKWTSRLTSTGHTGTWECKKQ